MLKNLFSDVLSPENLAPYKSLDELSKATNIFSFYGLPKHWRLKYEPDKNFIAYLILNEWKEVDTASVEDVSTYLTRSWLTHYGVSELEDISYDTLIKAASFSINKEYTILLLRCKHIVDFISYGEAPCPEILEYLIENTKAEEWTDTPTSYFIRSNLEDIQAAHKNYTENKERTSLAKLLNSQMAESLELRDITDVYIQREYYRIDNDQAKCEYYSGKEIILSAIGATIELDFESHSSVHIAKVGDVIAIYNVSGNVTIKLHSDAFVQHCYTRMPGQASLTYKDSSVTLLDYWTHDSDNLRFVNCKVFCKEPDRKQCEFIDSEISAMEFSPSVIASLAPNIFKNKDTAANQLVSEALKTIPETYNYLYL